MIAGLESQEFTFKKIHLEFACELSSSTDSLCSQYSPQYFTALDSLFKHARGELYLMLKYFSINFSNGRGFDLDFHLADVASQ